MRTRSIRSVVLGLAAGVVLAACGGTQQAGSGDRLPSPGRSPSSADLKVQVASYDLVSGEESRVLVGLLTPSNEIVVGGSVELAFFFLGEDGTASPQPGPRAAGEFLPVPGKAPDPVPDEPTTGDFADGVGVYQAQVAFDRPGAWGIAVQARTAEGETRIGTSRFEVSADHAVPTVGDPAAAGDNLTVASTGAAKSAIDSRANDEGEVPDPELHATTIADAVDGGRPVLAVFSTPVYCVSQFCGPVTEMVEELADTYRDRAAFVHVEVWRDFDAEALNDTAAAWLEESGGGLTEPWIFLVGRDGRIAARWGNVPDRAAIEGALDGLRPTGGGS